MKVNLQFAWLIILSLCLFNVENTLVYGQCLEDQKALLLQWKQNITFSTTAASTLTSWDFNTDCCSSWDGIKCDKDGHVISIDFSNKSITSGVENTSSLSELGFLKSLNLSFNDFSSTIPSGLDRLVNLTHLNLSTSGFEGQIPIEISRMKRLVSLDLSTLYAVSSNPLKLEKPDLKTLVKNLSELRELYLDGVNVSMNGKEWCQSLSSALPNLEVLSLSSCSLSGPFDSSLLNLKSLSGLALNQNNITAEVPGFFGNFSKLSFLRIGGSELIGKFPEKIFQLPLLRSLDVSTNPNLQGSLPEFPESGSLENLVLSNTNFTGKLPVSIGNLRFLSKLELPNCGFSGSIPASMSNLTRLQYLDLSSNNFTGTLPSFGSSENLTLVNLAHNQLAGSISTSEWSGNLKFVSLNLRNNLFNGTIPSTLFTLPSLQMLDLSQNRFTGPLSEFHNGSSLLLDTLDLSENMLEGSFPLSFFNLTSLKMLSLAWNNFSDTLRLDRLQNLRNLSNLDLSGSKLSIESSGTNSALFPQVGTLKLGSCNLKTFPGFLRNQSTLSHLDLSNNQIGGKMPNWIGQIGKGSLLHLNLSFNFLEDPDQPLPKVLFNSSLAVVDLHSNLLQGPLLPILPLSATFLDYSKNNITSIIPTDIGSYLKFAIFFSLSRNSLSGKIPLSMCNATFLKVLDLSNNSLSGPIPTCLGSISTLTVLNLRSNKFNGTMPETFHQECSLRTLDLNNNTLEGKLSTALSNCLMLEVLDVGNNQMSDRFPCWLGKLSHLRVLILRFNKFRGSIPPEEKNLPMLQIIDVSSNDFNGNLPSQIFLRLKGMMTDEEEAQSNYKYQILRFGFLELNRLYYQDAVTVTSKGLQMELVKILTIFTSLDMSNNNFTGEIPDAIGNLTSLYVLNLSGNALTGSIPRSLGNLKQLESLDLSTNNLSGQIPSQLADLSFLSVLNLSFNNFVGRIPQGRQFQTFNGNVFEGNKGLCGSPLSITCENVTKSAPLHPTSDPTCKFSLFKNCAGGDGCNWQLVSVALGYGTGVGIAFCVVTFCGSWNRLCVAISKKILKDRRR
ncbi:hypothetical protein IFM89_026604 [Coptis chinensis]|uniref:Leucine-rich repeat-containing N-terminal plant-type domain-containing protein n=1 Tax=Coptis chinensis TaxID=261450 RepID=A0A835LKK5_9MAGN|nr:hypothetical protein IFM89_026604 [Coptis chinensis]